MATWLALELQDEPGSAGRSVAEDVFINRGNDLAERLQLIYMQRAAKFLIDVDAEYKRLRNGNFRKPGEFPTIMLTLPLGTATVQFDAELDSQLLFLYVVHGWAGIRELERQLQFRREYPGAGQPEPWESALSFFRITRHLFALRIRDALIRVEGTLRRVIFEQIEASRRSLDDAIAILKISRDPPNKASGPLQARNEVTLADAFERISAVFQKRQVLARLRLDVQVLEARVGAHRQALRQRTEGLSGGVITPAERDEMQDAKNIKELDAERERVAAEAEDTDKALKDLSAALGKLLPPLLLAVPQLKDKFTRADFDKAVVETIISMRKIIDDLARGTAPSGSSVALHVPFDITSLERLDKVDLESLDVAAIVAKNALDQIGDDLAQTALVDEQTLREALSRAVFPVGGFEYIVASHYAFALLDETEALQKEEEKWKKVADTCTKISAVASLSSAVAAATATPQGLAAAGTLRIAAFAFSVPPMIFCAYSVVHQLSKLDNAIRLRVASADFGDIDSVVRLGDLIELREQQVEELTAVVVQLLIEQIMNDVMVVKKFLLWRGYLYDIESLIVADPAEATNG